MECCIVSLAMGEVFRKYWLEEADRQTSLS